MKIDLLYAKDLSSEEKKKLKSLTYREDGDMMYALEYCSVMRRNPRRYRVIRVTDDDGRILSWGLMQKKQGGRWDFQVYTRKSERGKGYGGMVYRKALQIAHGRANLAVHPHDDVSVSYFNKLHYSIIDKRDA